MTIHHPRGFADPVLHAQTVFRAVMGALARPGTTLPLPAMPVAPPPLMSEAASVILTLADHETSVWLGDGLAGSQHVLEFLRFHTGAAMSQDPLQATFAIAACNERLPPLEAFAQGTDEYPDRSTTLILTVDSFTEGPELRLEGPGIRQFASLRLDALPKEFLAQLTENRSRFPRGVDCIFVGDGKVAALPRTTIVTEA